MDVLEHLTEEHRKVEALLAQLKEADEGQRADLLDQLDEALGTHMAVEERFLYPIVAEVMGEEDAAEATDEHDLARDGLAAARERLEEGAFVAAIETLEAGIAHHVEEEESELFPKLREQAGDRIAQMDPEDLEAKVERAMGMHGARYLHVMVPCPLGWGSASSDTVKLARLATESGFFPVFEAERGEVTSVRKIRHQVPVEEYLTLQGRYAHLFRPQRRDDVIDRLQAIADRNIARYGLLEEVL